MMRTVWRNDGRINVTQQQNNQSTIASTLSAFFEIRNIYDHGNWVGVGIFDRF
jgi:hypothetical protein